VCPVGVNSGALPADGIAKRCNTDGCDAMRNRAHHAAQRQVIHNLMIRHDPR